MGYRIKDESGELWWCNSHGRRATHINRFGDHCCAPGQAGILLPCMAVNLTGISKIFDEADRCTEEMDKLDGNQLDQLTKLFSELK